MLGFFSIYNPTSIQKNQEAPKLPLSLSSFLIFLISFSFQKKENLRCCMHKKNIQGEGTCIVFYFKTRENKRIGIRFYDIVGMINQEKYYM